jgi:adenosylcobinamide kinase/adenosylcobinamide-phosphate guanylyltransferase
MRTLVTGGVKSGKSSFALELAQARRFDTGEKGPRLRFLATAEAFDEEMREKIRLHRLERAAVWETIEEPVRIDEAVAGCGILDCIPMWLNNLYYRGIESQWPEILERLVAALPEEIVIVTNETGMGTIPVDLLSRRYHTDLGTINKRLARACDRVVLMVAGIPLVVKGPPL